MSEVIPYEQDFYAWAMHNAQLMRQGNLTALDLTNLAEEIEGIGISQKHALESRLIVLLTHLLKWQFQPGYRCGSWIGTINEQRKRIQYLLRDSPSLKPLLESKLVDAYDVAISSAAAETGLAETTFPTTCPYSSEQILDRNFYPG
jgi:hypothetical protein